MSQHGQGQEMKRPLLLWGILLAGCVSTGLAAGVGFVENWEDDTVGSPPGSPWYTDPHMANGSLTITDEIDRYGNPGKGLLINGLDFNGKDAGNQAMLVPNGQCVVATDGHPLTVQYYVRPLLGRQIDAKWAEWYIEISLGDVHAPRLADVGIDNESALPAAIPVIAYCKPFLNPSEPSKGQCYFNGKVWQYYGPLDYSDSWQRKIFKISSQWVWIDCGCNNNPATILRRYLGEFDRISIYTRDCVYSTLTAMDDVSVVGGQVVHSLQLTPEDTLSSFGGPGGPFVPACKTYALTNLGLSSLGWTATAGQNWISPTPASGTLAAGNMVVVGTMVDENGLTQEMWDVVGGGAVDVNACFNTNADSLPVGNYTDQIAFTNVAANDIQNRNVELFVGNVDAFTEQFDTNNDLDHLSLTFTPDGSVRYYEACSSAATAFPTDPARGVPLAVTGDSFVKVTLAQGAQVKLYGTAYSEFYVGANGYITFGSGDTDATETLADHFSKPRISALFTDLNPGTNAVSWKQLMDRAAVTYANVPEIGVAGGNSFQIELFYDGRIRMTWLDIAAIDGLAGLSRGAGTPPDHLPSNLNGYIACPPATHHPADLDSDGDVDLDDFGKVQSCLTGSNVLVIWPDCAGADFDMDGDVDSSDVESIRGCLSGPLLPPVAGCLTLAP